MRLAIIVMLFIATIGAAQAQNCQLSFHDKLGNGLLCDTEVADRQCTYLITQEKWFCPGGMSNNNSGPPQGAVLIEEGTITTAVEPISPQPGYSTGGVPYWGSLQPGGVMDAAWCLTKDNNKQIKDKSMRDGNCATMLLEFPWAAVVSEHRMGEAAIAMACGADVASIVGLPLPTEGPLFPLMFCQCHNIGSQQNIIRDGDAVIAALRQWGGCS